MQNKHFYILTLILFALLSTPANCSGLSLSGSWQLEGEVWGGQLQAPNLEEELPGVKQMPKLTGSGWNQELNLALDWSPSQNSSFHLDLVDCGDWGVGFASDGSWGRQSTYGPVLIHQAFASYKRSRLQLRAGRFQPSLDNSLLGGGPISLEGIEANWQLGTLTVGASSFRLSSLYWPNTDYVVAADNLVSLKVSGVRENLAWGLVALPDEFGTARGAGGQLAFRALGGITSGQGAVWQDKGYLAPAVELSGNWQWEDQALALSVAMVDPAFTPILSTLSGQAEVDLLADRSSPFSTGSMGIAASWGRQLGKVLVELHGTCRKLEQGWQENLGVALYLPQESREFSLSVDLLSAACTTARAKVGWEISF